jgi:hypothetical protein
VPKGDRAFDTRHRRQSRWFRPYRAYVRNRLFWIHESRTAGFVSDPSAMAAMKALARQLLERQVPDVALRATLTPDYKIGCKRLLISSTWYPTLSGPDVDVRPGPVREVLPGAVVGADGVPVPADVIIYGTGFDTRHNLTRLRIVGRDGIELGDAWKDGNEAYLGTTVTGFPNLFVMAGPDTGLGHNSQVFMIEAQARYVIDPGRRVARAVGCGGEPVRDSRAGCAERDRLGRPSRRGHLRWPGGGGGLPALVVLRPGRSAAGRHREWVLHDLTCRSWWLRHLARSLVQLVPVVAVLVLLIPGPFWVRGWR